MGDRVRPTKLQLQLQERLHGACKLAQPGSEGLNSILYNHIFCFAKEIPLTEGNTLSLKAGELGGSRELLGLHFSVSFLSHNTDDTRRAMTRTMRTMTMTPTTIMKSDKDDIDKIVNENDHSGSASSLALASTPDPMNKTDQS